MVDEAPNFERGSKDPRAWALHIINRLLEHKKWVVVRYDYYGSGDSLNDDFIYVYTDWARFDSGDGHSEDSESNEKKMPEDLAQEIRSFGQTIVDGEHPGWENNDGGHGEVTFYLAASPLDEAITEPCVGFKHWDYVTTEELRSDRVIAYV
jgi:hypothetical protein